MRFNLEIKGLAEAQAKVAGIIAAMPTWAVPSMLDVMRILKDSAERQAAGVPPRSATAKKLRPSSAGVGGLVKFVQEDLSVSTASLRLELRGLSLLQKGGTTAPGSMIPGKKVPARAFMKLTTDARSDVSDRMHASLLDVLRGGG